MEGQTLATLQSFVGDTLGSLATMDRAVPQAHRATSPDSSETESPPLPALAEILKEAKGRQIVMLNEAHDSPRCRAFALQLALALRKEGFTYFAAETFTSEIQQTVSKGYPNRKTGFYTFEPVFGDLVRQVIRAGYRLVPYETEEQNVKGDSTDRLISREAAQARNLEKRILQKDPKARVFVYAGYSHITEDTRMTKDGRDASWMAARLKRDTGIDPLTIDQTGAAEHSDPKYENPEYVRLVNRYHFNPPSVFRAADGAWRVMGDYRGKVDMQVVFPRTRLRDGRPDWLREAGRRPCNVSPDWLPATDRALIQAFVATEPDNAIPMDQIIVMAGHPPPVLMLPPGEYRILSQLDDGTSRVVGPRRL